jgi:Viral BACON domain
MGTGRIAEPAEGHLNNTRNWRIAGFWILLCAASLAAAPARSTDIIGTSANFTWAAASGPVAGYAVFVNRNGTGFPAAPDQLVTASQATVSGSYGDTIVIAVAAYDASNTFGPLSTDSALYQFVAASTSTTAAAVLTLSATTLTGTAVQGQSQATTSFLIQNTGGGTLSYSLSTGAAWLSVSPTGGASTGTADTIMVTMNPSGLGAGTYTSTITATAAGATGSPATIGVIFTVSPPPTLAPPPSLGLSATELSATAFQGQGPVTASFTVTNTGGGTLSYSLSTGAPWLSVSPTSGTSTGSANTIVVTMNPSGLRTGTYTSAITAAAAGATGSPATIAVTFRVSSKHHRH